MSQPIGNTCAYPSSTYTTNPIYLPYKQPANYHVHTLTNIPISHKNTYIPFHPIPIPHPFLNTHFKLI